MYLLLHEQALVQRKLGLASRKLGEGGIRRRFCEILRSSTCIDTVIYEARDCQWIKRDATRTTLKRLQLDYVTTADVPAWPASGSGCHSSSTSSPSTHLHYTPTRHCKIYFHLSNKANEIELNSYGVDALKNALKSATSAFSTVEWYVAIRQATLCSSLIYT